ncbi:PaaX family transcriptional regulator C-terminal domain-containing protein [Streptomyces zaomyceticus]|uniref:PaaX family transcriptional regulator C-terminal domain-containing protein n=1 Tax=Streptomyces zaomyceticus TaxID=68286 RepID=UPI0016728B75|nr:PaaX family transcriptional regulator C-terminal domain-containing protein [Streptomyces zaomyceticus]GHG08924.1 putative repressor in the phenylacetic acid catabolism [Streptomyces zaomyceticus]
MTPGTPEAPEASGIPAPEAPEAPDGSATPWNTVSTRTLVHALVRTDGTVDAGELYTVAGLLSMSDQQVRLCVKRLVAEGRFTHEGRGRKAVLRAVADPTGSFAPDADHVRFAYRQDHGLAPWDGRWHLFAFAVPESARAARDALRDTLLGLGATPLQGGLYAAANPIAPLVEARAHQLGVASQLTCLTSADLRIGALSEPRALAAALWPLDEIAARHERLAVFARSCLDRPGRPGPTDREPLTAPGRLTLAVRLAAAFTYAMRPDPLLPPELLPRPWPGARAREVFASAWTALTKTPAPDSGSPLPRLFALYEDLADRTR